MDDEWKKLAGFEACTDCCVGGADTEEFYNIIVFRHYQGTSIDLVPFG